MTHDYKAALDEIDRTIEKAIDNGDFGGFDGMILVDGWIHENSIAAIRSALQLAQEAEQVRLKLSETAIHLAARNSEIEQLRKETERLVRENEVFAERHKAWESCVYTVGLPVIRDVRDTEYGDAVPQVPVVNKVTDLLDECNKLRKERDELARAIIKIHEDQEGDYDFLKFISRPQYILAKKAAGE